MKAQSHAHEPRRARVKTRDIPFMTSSRRTDQNLQMFHYFYVGFDKISFTVKTCFLEAQTAKKMDERRI